MQIILKSSHHLAIAGLKSLMLVFLDIFQEAYLHGLFNFKSFYLKLKSVFHLTCVWFFSASGHIFRKKSYWNTVHGVFNEWGTLLDLQFLASYKVHNLNN